MEHLKECPWDQGEAWRPARLQLAQTSDGHRAELCASRNYVQHQQTRVNQAKGVGLEESIRAAVRSGKWPTKEEAHSASFLQGGWDEYQRTGKPNGTLSASLKTLSSPSRVRPLAGVSFAEKYNLVPQEQQLSPASRPSSSGSRVAPLRPGLQARVAAPDALSVCSQQSGASSSASPMARAGCSPTAVTMPRGGSCPALGASSFVNRSNLRYSQTMQQVGGLYSLQASGSPAGGREYRGTMGRCLGF